MRQQDDDASDGLQFETAAPRIYIDFNVKPGLRPNDTTTIFLGAAKAHPESRRGRIPVGRASGEPNVDAPGTYIWHDPASGAWHVVWRYDGSSEDALDERGSIAAAGVTGVSTPDLEAWPVEETTDRIFLNDGGGRFERLEGFELKHASATVAASLVDVDTDGDLDIIGLRANPPGDFNGEVFLAVNDGGTRYHLVEDAGLESLPPGSSLRQRIEIFVRLTQEHHVPIHGRVDGNCRFNLLPCGPGGWTSTS